MWREGQLRHTQAVVVQLLQGLPGANFPDPNRCKVCTLQLQLSAVRYC